ncbi:MAG: GDYXXLXY domain-containing protein [Casimicrobiaceae bacterium]
MTITWQRVLIVLGLALVLGAAHWSIMARERLLADGNVVFLELAPVDPRSLMQGDYMALRFRVAEALRSRDVTVPAEGAMVVTLDRARTATLQRLDAPATPLAAGEQRLRYKIRNDQVRISTNAFFFREGTGDRYRDARYGEFHVGESGEALLVALRDKNFKKLGDAL